MRHPLDTTPDDAPLEKIVATGGFSDISRYEHAAEHQRLKDAVVEAAKTFRDKNGWSGSKWEDFRTSVDALIQFESKGGVEE